MSKRFDTHKKTAGVSLSIPGVKLRSSSLSVTIPRAVAQQSPGLTHLLTSAHMHSPTRDALGEHQYEAIKHQEGLRRESELLAGVYFNWSL